MVTMYQLNPILLSFDILISYLNGRNKYVDEIRLALTFVYLYKCYGYLLNRVEIINVFLK